MIRSYLSRPQLLIVAAIVVAAQFIPLPFVVLQPGPTYNLLGKALTLPADLQQPTPGQLLATTVYVTNPSARIYAPQLLVAWVNGQMAVYPRDVIYPKNESSKATLAAGKAEMTSSESVAISAAANFIASLPNVPNASALNTVNTQALSDRLRKAEIKFSLQETGGPSAGLGFALSLLDRIIDPALIGHRTVAATGTITAHGDVGAIGGIDQKLSGAARSGASLFLLPRENCVDITRVPRGLRLAPVSSLGEAVHVLSGALVTHC